MCLGTLFQRKRRDHRGHRAAHLLCWLVLAGFAVALGLVITNGIRGQYWLAWIISVQELVAVYFCVYVLLASVLVGGRATCSFTAEERWEPRRTAEASGGTERHLRAKSLEALWTVRPLDYGVLVGLGVGIFFGKMNVLRLTSAVLISTGYVFFVCQAGQWLSLRCRNTRGAVAWMSVTFLVTVMGPGSFWWVGLIDHFSPPCAVWGVLTVDRGGDRVGVWWESPTQLFPMVFEVLLASLPGLLYAAIGYRMSRSTLDRIERDIADHPASNP